MSTLSHRNPKAWGANSFYPASILRNDRSSVFASLELFIFFAMLLEEAGIVISSPYVGGEASRIPLLDEVPRFPQQ